MIRARVAAVLAAFLAAALPARADIQIKEVISPGGITAWLVEDHNIPFTALEIHFRGGTSLDAPGKRGAVNLMTALIEEGAGGMDSRAFAEARDALAGRSYAEQYVQTLAHEIKSPLAAIRGAAELLREPMSESARARFAGNIEEQVARAQDLIERMLELTHLERRGSLERIELVSLAQVVRLVVAEATPIAERRHMRFEVDVAEPLLASGDAFLLQRAISNLVRNAIDFAPVHSTVEIAARETGRQIALTVHDYGPGLPPYAARRVFEKFFSTARPDSGKKGTGLGLAFVKEVAALHGGAARLANHPEGGAVATLLLPRATAA